MRSLVMTRRREGGFGRFSPRPRVPPSPRLKLDRQEGPTTFPYLDRTDAVSPPPGPASCPHRSRPSSGAEALGASEKKERRRKSAADRALPRTRGRAPDPAALRASGATRSASAPPRGCRTRGEI